MMKMFKKKDGDPKKALMAKSSSTPAPKMLKSGMKGALSEANSMIGKKMPKSSASKFKPKSPKATGTIKRVDRDMNGKVIREYPTERLKTKSISKKEYDK